MPRTFSSQFGIALIVEIIVGALLIFILVLAAVKINGFGNQPLETFAYDNGAGDSFSTDFYPNSETKKLSDLPGLGKSETESNLAGLVSPDFDDDGLAMVFYILKRGGTGSACKTTAFSVTIAGARDEVCTIESQGTPVIYYTNFSSNGKNYWASAMLKYDDQKAQNRNDAGRIVSKIDLRKYDKDLKQIFSSVKVK